MLAFALPALGRVLGGREWAFPIELLHRVAPVRYDAAGEDRAWVFETQGPRFTSDAEFLQRWAGAVAPQVVLRSYVRYDSLTDAFPDGTPFPWMSDVEFPQ